ncbi:MAG: hypothetical protein HY582_03475 [Candidatus Omnitrophica bacterium]|nr:hypothetical protein [Candidatus Omnitrophota bacterium]
MKRKWIRSVCLLSAVFVLCNIPAGSFADEAQYYIDQFAQQVAQDVASGKIDEMVKPVSPSGSDAGVGESTPASTGGGFDFVRFFAGTLGPDEFSDPNWFMDPAEVTGSYIFGDSVQNPTGFRTDGTYVSGSDIDRASGTRTINDATLRDQVNAFREDQSDANRSNIESSLRDLGFDGSFIIES